MERMTHEADFGLEDWEETLFFVKSDPNGAYNILDIAKYQGESGFDEILKNVALRLAAYENTGLEPEEIVKIREDIENGYMKSTARRYGVPVDRLRELAEADREGRCVVLPCKVGDVVYEIRYTAENIKPSKHAKKKFDHSVSGCTWRMRARPDMCYVSEKKCTKSDFSFMGRTVFLTRAEAGEALKAREQND